MIASAPVPLRRVGWSHRGAATRGVAVHALDGELTRCRREGEFRRRLVHHLTGRGPLPHTGGQLPCPSPHGTSCLGAASENCGGGYLRWLLTVAASFALTMSACAPLRPPSQSQMASEPSRGELAPNPPAALVQSLRSRGLSFVPPSSAQLASVTVSRSRAEEIAIATMQSDRENRTREWAIGFAFLGIYTTAPAVHSSPTSAIAYLVQVIDRSGKGLPPTTAYVAVNAQTGEHIEVVAPCIGPTCRSA